MWRPRPTSNEATPQTDEMYSGCGDGVSTLVMFGPHLNRLLPSAISRALGSTAGPRLGHISPSSHAAILRLRRKLSGRPADQVEGHVLDGSKIGGGVISTHAALVVAEDHVHNPVEAVLDAPMCTKVVRLATLT